MLNTYRAIIKPRLDGGYLAVAANILKRLPRGNLFLVPVNVKRIYQYSKGVLPIRNGTLEPIVLSWWQYGFNHNFFTIG